MITLGLDTATSLLSVALVRGDEVLALETSDARRGQSEVLMPIIESCCKQAKIELRDIARLCAVTGPGSFTGLRIGLAAVRGLAMGLSIPASGLSAFEAARLAVPSANVIVLESWREELFIQFGDDAPGMLTAPEIVSRLTPQSVLTGDAVAKVPGAKTIPMPALAPVAARANGTEALEPFYLRAPDVTTPAA